MPQTWMTVSAGTPEWLARFVDEPTDFEQFVGTVLAFVHEQHGKDAGEPAPALLAVYYQVDKPLAHIIVRDLDNAVTLKAVCQYLGAQSVTKLLVPSQAKTAVERYRGLQQQFAPG